MNSIEILNDLEVGMPVIVTTKGQCCIMRDVCLYMGKDKEDRYNFFNNNDGITGVFAYSTKYIIDHVTIETEINDTFSHASPTLSGSSNVQLLKETTINATGATVNANNLEHFIS